MSRRDGLVPVYASLGATAASIGPLLPPLTERLQTTSATVSLATTFLFAGLVAGAALAAAARRTSAAGVVVGGGVVQVGGVLAVAAAPSVPLLYVAAGVLGAGFGAVEVTASVLAGSGRDGPRRLALLTAVFAAAAIATPAVVAASVAATDGVLLAGSLVAAVHLTAAVAIARARPVAVTSGPAAGGSGTRPRGTARLTLLLVAYVGAEATVATWSGELGRVLLDLTTAEASLVPTAFWLCLLLGRLGATVALRRLPAERVLTGTLVVAGLGGLAGALVAPVAGGGALALAAVTVVAMGPVYGVALSFGARPTAGTPMARTAWLVAIGAVGGATIPAIVAPASAGGPSAVLGVVGGFLALAAVLSRTGSRTVHVEVAP